jgi:glutamate N-acetyltransferase/amino-acid N-acetyltransferase
MLADVVDETFNCISVEGHTSTNDTVLLLSSGHSDARLTDETSRGRFTGALREVCLELARAIPNDGEGASHLIEVKVVGCRSRHDARKVARTVADSPLVKTAIAGADPNWGRIVSAAGYAEVDFDPRDVDLGINGTTLYERGAPVPFDVERVSAAMRDSREIKIDLRLGQGPGEICFWTSDLTAEYVRINADYHT